MQQSDYILREIEKISIMLLGMLGKMVVRKKEGIELNEDEYSALNVQLLSEGNIELDEILQKRSDDFEDFFRNAKGFDEKNIELLADLLVTFAGLLPEDTREQHYLKAFQIYEFLDITYQTFSFERIEKKRAVQTILNLPEA